MRKRAGLLIALIIAGLVTVIAADPAPGLAKLKRRDRWPGCVGRPPPTRLIPLLAWRN
ncbi:hypothetical protein AB0M54_02265 [Actinoplanes sp. NPDC051470]|uniref:hypothetical protein n=1 Tax=unclassified Actinoplanes TaxID=2626549 RepID=UPI003421AC3C